MDQKFEFSPARPGEDKRQQKDKRILFIGRLDHHKGADILLELFLEYLVKYNDKSTLVLIGRNCFCKEYGRMFLEEWEAKIPEEYKDRIEFTGQLDHGTVELYIKKATICIFPSRWEVFGIVCLEAMAYGVPALVSKGTGLAELLGEGLEENCFNFKTDKDAFFQRLQKLFADPSDNEVLRQQFRTRATEIIQRGEQGYRELVNQRGKIQDEGLSQDALKNILNSLKAMSEISGFLGNDFLKLKQYFKASDDDVKMIVKKGEEESATVYQRFKSMIK